MIRRTYSIPAAHNLGIVHIADVQPVRPLPAVETTQPAIS